ncbi:MAG TPA: site-2 protease family protein [Candidatus Angelobacter sp.]|jgi:regulator of sigma E protease|nr:site-2 protease family protein [Candidatus Angelobacter sp.]
MDVLRTVVAIMALLVVVVVVHEMGHFLVAKRSGIQVDEFAVGFGPKLIWKRVGDTVYALRLLPAGGFVRLAGMTGLPEEKDPGPRAFWRASIPKRVATILAGGVFNLIFAGLLFSALAIPSQASAVDAGTPLASAGLHSGDTILTVNGRHINDADEAAVTADMHAATRATEGHPATVVYQTPGGAVRTTTVTPVLELLNLDRSNPLPQQIIVDSIDGNSVTPGDPAMLFHSGNAVKVSGHVIGDTKVYTGTVAGVSTGNGDVGRVDAAWLFGFQPGWAGNTPAYAAGRGFTKVPTAIAGTFTGLYQILTTPNSGGLSGNVQGPVGIVRDTGAAAQAGWMVFLTFMAYISLSLGLFNLLPIPFLDGGRFVFIILEAIRRRRVDPRREAMIHYVGLMLILALVFYVTFTGDIGGRAT